MSLNTAHANNGVLIYNGELILLYCDGVEMTMEGAKEFEGTKKGRIYLTTHRMIFINKSSKDHLQSFSFPFFCLHEVGLEQPLFGANYIKGSVEAQPNGNWSGKATFKLKFFSGGAIEFGQAMLKAAQMASQHVMDRPPPYMLQTGPYFPAPPPAYTPPSGGINGFVPPTHVFPDAPPANSVYTSDMPPPYPGLYPPYAYPPGGRNYPQATANGGLDYGPYYTPPPPGFNAPSGGMPPQGASAPPPGATAPPPYDNSTPYQPGPYAQYNGSYQQAPPGSDTKSGVPPLVDCYAWSHNARTIYIPQSACQNNEGAPPPYTPEKKEQ